MKLEMEKSTYIELKTFFETFFPDIKFRSVIIDEMLVNLGFAKDAPCIAELDITEEQLDACVEFCCDLVDEEMESKYSWIGYYLYNVYRDEN